jgi:cytidylate kinase
MLLHQNRRLGQGGFVFNIITIEREYGAGGSIVAEHLARHFGWKLLDQELTSRIAAEACVDPSVVAGCDEHLDRPLRRLAKVFWRGSYERMIPMQDERVFDADCMVEIATKIITEAGEEGRCVIVGRGAPYILRQRKDAFHVFLYAPRDFKIQRLARRMSEKEATELVDTIDRERAEFIKRYFNKEWPCRSLYHMMLNTGKGVDAAVETVLGTMKIMDLQPVR